MCSGFYETSLVRGGGLQPAIEQRGGLSKIRCLAARREPDVEIDVELSEDGVSADWRYSIGITQQVRGFRQPILRHEKVWKGGQLILERPDHSDEDDELRLTQTHLEQISSNANFRDIARLFESIRYLHLVPQMLRHPESFQGKAAQEDPFGRNFLEMVARTPEKTRKSRLARIEAALRKAVPQLTNLTDTKDEAGVPHLEATYAHWRPNAGRQREDQFSDGTLRLIGPFLVVARWRRTAPPGRTRALTTLGNRQQTARFDLFATAATQTPDLR